jgi:hypothetical protein
VERRSVDGRGKPLDVGITKPINVEIHGRPMSSSGHCVADHDDDDVIGIE